MPQHRRSAGLPCFADVESRRRLSDSHFPCVSMMQPSQATKRSLHAARRTATQTSTFPKKPRTMTPRRATAALPVQAVHTPPSCSPLMPPSTFSPSLRQAQPPPWRSGFAATRGPRRRRGEESPEAQLDRWRGGWHRHISGKWPAPTSCSKNHRNKYRNGRVGPPWRLSGLARCLIGLLRHISLSTPGVQGEKITLSILGLRTATDVHNEGCVCAARHNSLKAT